MVAILLDVSKTKTTRYPCQDTLHHKSFVMMYNKVALPLTKFLVKKMGGNQEAAEEVFSRTVMAAWCGLHTFEHRSEFFTWVCKIGLNKMADYYREQINERSKLIAPGLEILGSFKDNQLSPEEKLILLELRTSVKECLMLLPEEKRQLLYLRFWQELTLKEIANILEVSERAAEGKLYRAKFALREVVSTHHPELTSGFCGLKN